jgi:hypothetical protein
MKRTTLLLMALTVFGARGAWAGNDFNVNVVLGNDGKVAACTVAALATADQDDGVNVSVKDGNGKAQAPSEVLSVQVLDGAKEFAKLDLDAPNAALPRGMYANLKLSLMDAKGAVIEACTKLLAPAPKDPGIKAEPVAPPSELNASLLNEQALIWLANKKITGHAVTGGVHGKVYRLYHLPDGTPAFPMPAHASEEDRIELWLVLPSGAKATVEVIACDKVPDVRVHGSYKDVLDDAGQLHGREAIEFVLTSYPKPLQCAGTLTYKITPTGKGTGGSTTNAIILDPVYRFEWSVGYGFDFGKPRRLGLADRQPASGAGADKVVVDPSEFTGAKPIITLLVDVCGTNPAELDWCDRYLNPTLWLDPTRLQKGFGVGLTVRPFFGVGILAGVSVFKSTELADGVSVNPGDTWTATGDLPTKEVFNRKSLGLMLAATVDADIFAKLLK